MSPSLYQINTRVWMTELSKRLGRSATLDDVADAELDAVGARGFDWVWLLGVWQTGAAGQAVSRSRPEWRREFQETLPDLQEADIAGSCFAITDYHVHAELGGDEALARIRERLKQRGLRLMLDFVPNHTALDHPWATSHPDYYVGGSEEQLAAAPQNFIRLALGGGSRIFAHGRDPYFDGWPDTLQLNYANLALQDAMIGELVRIAGQCDGVRCDMAMLALPDVFERTWGGRPAEFWPDATAAARTAHPGFTFLAEVYWDLEWALQQRGFDYAYDKRLYDRLREGHARPVREHLFAELDYQNKLARFLENHDEPRAAATFSPDVHEAAAVITYLSPGMRFFHQGQFEGKTKRISPHLLRGPDEPVNERLKQFYDRLLPILRRAAVREGQWQLVECAPAWAENWTWDCFVACACRGSGGERLVAIVNYAPNQSQCRARIPFADLAGAEWKFQDLLSDAIYIRSGADLQSQGMYFDVAPWQRHVFSLRRA